MVNKKIINDAYPMHRFKDQLEAMSGSSVFCILTWQNYHQMKLVEGKKNTAFNTPRGCYCGNFAPGNEDLWNTVPETDGYNAQKAESLLCGGLYWQYCLFSPSIIQHLIDLGEVLKPLTSLNPKLNLEKCDLWRWRWKCWDNFSQSKQSVVILTKWTVKN